MEFVAILICLAIERWTPYGKHIRKFCFFEKYTHFFRSFKLPAYWGIAAMVLPVVLLIGALYWWSTAVLFQIFSFFISLIVLLYCLGEFNLGHPAPPTRMAYENEQEREIAGLLEEAHHNTFAILFWFVVLGKLGPVGAVLYRLVSVLARHHKNEAYVAAAKHIQHLMDWIPMRLLAFSCALMSHFLVVLKRFSHLVLSGIRDNERVLTQCGFVAFEADWKKEHVTLEIIRAHILELMDRTLILWLVVIAILILI
jgi:AmpE protein